MEKNPSSADMEGAALAAPTERFIREAGPAAEIAALVERFELMREFAEILQKKRYKRGSIDFDLPEPLIEFDETGTMTGIARSERNTVHRRRSRAHIADTASCFSPHPAYPKTKCGASTSGTGGAVECYFAGGNLPPIHCA